MNNLYNKSTKFDLVVESLNKKIARLLGKRGHNIKPPKETHNLMFWLIMLVVVLFLWISTGFYYLSENMNGVILYKNKFSRVIKGLKVGVIMPYPLERIIILDVGSSHLQYLGQDGSDHTDYNVKLHDSQIIGLKVQFAYQITDSKKFYMGYLYNKYDRFSKEAQDRLQNEIVISIKNSINQNVANDDYHEAVTKNLTIMGNDIKNQVNQAMAKYGVSITKLNVVSLHLINQWQKAEVIAPVNPKNVVVPSVANVIIPNVSTPRNLERNVNRNVMRERK